MTLFYLIRHAEHDLLGRELAGRRAGVRLNARGREQAAGLGERLARIPFAAVLSSPRERARETAAPIAERQGRDVVAVPALDEVDFGAWTGRSFAALDRDPAWQAFNRRRAMAVIPGGETLLDIQGRVLRLLDELKRQHAQAGLALVTHGDVIRAAVLHCLGMPLDFIHRIEVSPASVTRLALDGDEPRLLALNLVAAEGF